MPRVPPSANNGQTDRLLVAPILPTLLGMALPNAFVMVTQVAIQLMEIVYIARLGVDVIAGVSVVFPLVALVLALSQGALGGGIVSGIARSLGRGDVAEASELAWHAVAIALSLGLAVTVLFALLGGPILTALGAQGASLDAATRYAAVMFGGGALIWVFNALLAVLRGTGNLALPSWVVGGGAALLVPLSPLLIFGAGGWTGFGAPGAAVALLIYYLGGCLCLLHHVWGHRGALRPSPWPPRFRFAPAWQILRVGGLSALIASSTNITIVITTGFVAAHDVVALAGYGAAVRLEFLLVPLTYGVGGPAGIMIATNLGAGQRRRALRTAWIATGIGAGVAGAIGCAASRWPGLWMALFSCDTAVIAAGSGYLTTVGPFFGCFGAAFALYCAAQGAGRMGWPLAGAFLRTVVAIVGGFVAARLEDVFWSVGAGMAVFALVAILSLLLRGGYRQADATEGECA